MLNFPVQTPDQVLDAFIPVFYRTYSDPILRDLYRQYVQKNNLDTLQSKVSMLHDLEIYTECEYSLLTQNTKADSKANVSNTLSFAYLSDMIKLLCAEHKLAAQAVPSTLSASMLNLLLKLLTDTLLHSDNLYGFDLNIQDYTKELMKDSVSHTSLVLKMENLRKQYKNEIGFEYGKQSFLRDYHRAMAGDYFACPLKRAALNQLPKQNQPELELRAMCQIGDTRFSKMPSRPFHLSSSVLHEHEYVKQVMDCIVKAVETTQMAQSADYKLIQSFLVNHLKEGRGLVGTPLKPFDARVKAFIQEVSAPYWFSPAIATELKAIRLIHKAKARDIEPDLIARHARHHTLNQHLKNKSNKAVIQQKLKALKDSTKMNTQMHTSFTLSVARLKAISMQSIHRFFHFKSVQKPIPASEHVDRLYYKDKAKPEKIICETIEKIKRPEPQLYPQDTQNRIDKALIFSHGHKALITQEPQDPIDELVLGIKNFFRKLTK